MTLPPTERVAARVDVLYVAAVIAVFAVFGALVGILVADPNVPWGAKVAVAAMALVGAGLTLGSALPVRYVLEPEGLTVRAGFLTLRLAYRDIVRAVPLVSPLTGPSWSLVRVRVALDGGGWIEIAPRDRDGFMAALAGRAPHLRAHGRALVDPERPGRRGGRT